MALEISDTVSITNFNYLLMQSSLKVKGVELYISFEDMMPTKFNSGQEDLTLLLRQLTCEATVIYNLWDVDYVMISIVSFQI